MMLKWREIKLKLTKQKIINLKLSLFLTKKGNWFFWDVREIESYKKFHLDNSKRVGILFIRKSLKKKKANEKVIIIGTNPKNYVSIATWCRRNKIKNVLISNGIIN
ncbi:MAG: hypothetical protein NC236_02995 [Mycoplasma sp.]|nr:hypothetical protein [Mycoplasma sp.]